MEIPVIGQMRVLPVTLLEEAAVEGTIMLEPELVVAEEVVGIAS